MAPAPPRKQPPHGKPRQAAPAPRPPPAPARPQRPEPLATPLQHRHEMPRQQAVQRKAALPTSQPGDAAEREADQRATQVMRSTAPVAAVQERPPATVQTERRQAAAAPATPSLSADHQARLGTGEALPQPLRGQFEARFGQDLGQVRIVNDGAAAQAAASIDARAFTLGQRIAFAPGEYRPDTPEGQWLLAHEITHVLQQQNSSVPRQVMRDATSGGGGPGGGGTPAGGAAAAPAGGGSTRAAATPGAPRYVLNTALRVPPIKGRHSPTYATLARHGGLIRPRAYDASTRGTAQMALWNGGVQPDLTRIPATHRPAPGSAWNLPLQVAGGTAVRHVTAGNDAELAAQLRRPNWDENGAPIEFQVDHMVEYQLGGNDHIDNMELLDQAHNGSVGSSFSHEIRRAVREELATTNQPPAVAGLTVPPSPTVSWVFDHFDLEFRNATGRGRESARTEGGARFFSRQHITQLEHVLGLLPGGGGVAGSASRVHVLSPSGNLIVLRLPVRNNNVTVPAAARGGIAGFEVQALNLPGGLPSISAAGAAAGVGTISGALNLGAAVSFPGGAEHTLSLDKAAEPYTLLIASSTTTPAGPDGARNATREPATFEPLSPMQLQDLQVGTGVVAQATISPSHPALAGLQLPAQVMNGRLGLFYTVDATTLAQRLPVPGLTIDAAAITLGYDGRAFRVQGGAEFSIRNFGTGYLGAGVDSEGRFELEGALRPDPRLFDRAEMRLWYRSEGGFGGEGSLAITDPNRIRGVRSANVRARYDAGVFSAEGSVEPAIPGLQAAGLTVRYGPDDSGAQSLLVGGDLQLAEGVPGVRGGTVHVQVQQTGEAWAVSAAGELQAAVPGLSATLRASYDEGAFSASVEAPFTAGDRVSGTLLVGVSNRPADSEGRPLEGAVPGDTLLAYGSGTATVRLSDALQADFDVRVATDAALSISGSVALAEPVTLFEQRRWERELLRVPTVSIPIFGVAVGGNVVGIAATIGGGLQAEASVGPGQIDEGRIAITDFNPAQPETLHATGRLRFVVPANAGITGHLDAGISAGAAIIRVTGGLSLGLGLGVDASVATPVDLDWTPNEGLVLAASLQASATPRLRASVNGFAEVVADALVTTFTLWRRDYTLAEREFGSGLRVGIEVPVAWRQQSGLDFDFDRVQFQVPDLSPEGALAALLRDEGSEHQENDEG